MSDTVKYDELKKLMEAFSVRCHRLQELSDAFKEVPGYSLTIRITGKRNVNYFLRAWHIKRAILEDFDKEHKETVKIAKVLQRLGVDAESSIVQRPEPKFNKEE